MEISLEFKRALEGAIPLTVNTSPLTDATTEPFVAANLDYQRICRFFRGSGAIAKYVYTRIYPTLNESLFHSPNGKVYEYGIHSEKEILLQQSK